MKYEVVNHMKEEVNIFEFTEMFNKAKQIFEVSTNLSFFDARVFNNMLLLYEIQKYCKSMNDMRNDRYSLDLVLEIVKNNIHKNMVMLKRKKIEEMCEINYYYIFMLK